MNPTTGLRAILRAACREVGFSDEAAHLIHHSSNAVFVLPHHQAVARVSTAAADLRRARSVTSLTAWLAARGFGATAPLAGARPLAVHGHDVSFWRYYPQSDALPPTSRDLGSLLRELHSTPPPAHIDLPNWVPLQSLRTALHDPRTDTGHITDLERSTLLNMIETVAGELADMSWPLGHGLIHGDAWAGNLLWDRTNDDAARPRAILGDWDWVSIGPFEVDLIPTWHAAIRYGRDQHWVTEFIATYGYDLSEFATGYETLRRMRDLVQVTGPLRRAGDSPANAARLRQRVHAILTGDTTSSWSQYS
ncbi:phosphotransferase [Nocardia africana]|nr:aminoglycoside phosphotransferase family protein [Nocardia africana]